MSVRCENGLDAVRIGLAPGDTADRNVVDLAANPNTAQASRSEVPLDLSEYPDPFPSFGWERLLPCNLQKGLLPYQIYLEEFYNIHKNSADVGARAPHKCLEKESKLEYCWGKFCKYSFPSVLSDRIKECMLQFMVNKEGESEHPFVFDAAACIAEEAELMVDWLMRGLQPDQDFGLSQEIRQMAYDLVMFKGEWSVEIAATLLGIRKEAKWLRENMDGSFESIETSMQIRLFALQFLRCMFYSGSGYTSEGSSEASEIDDVWADTEDDSSETGNCCKGASLSRA